MWFGLKLLLWQNVFLLDEEIIVYSRAQVLFICILRSSPAHMLRSKFELCSGRNSPSSEEKWVYFLSCLEEFWTSNWDGRNILIASDNNTLQYKWITKADCEDNHVSSLAGCSKSWALVIFYCRSVLRSKPLMWDQTVCTSVRFFWCVCVWAGEEGRYRAGRIIRLPLITHRWLILELRVWRCPSIHHFLLYTHVHTQTLAATQTQLMSWELQYHAGAQVTGA